MASVCDGAVIVLNAGTIKYRVAQGVKEQLQKSGCKILGVILNQVNRKGSSGSSNSYYSAKYSSEYYGYHDNARSQHEARQKSASGATAPRAPQARPVNKTQK